MNFLNSDKKKKKISKNVEQNLFPSLGKLMFSPALHRVKDIFLPDLKLCAVTGVLNMLSTSVQPGS